MKKLLTLAAGLMLLLAMQASSAQTIREFRTDNFAEVIAGHKGKPFVLILWSLDCEFCQASLNTLSRKKRSNRHLRIVTLGTDSLADEQAAALMKSRLAAFGLKDSAWAFGAEPPEQLRYAIDKKWHGELPRSYWFNADGEVTARSGVISAETVDRFLNAR
ncbi:MAG: hypothetical protein WA191_23990 [Telluria sp.]